MLHGYSFEGSKSFLTRVHCFKKTTQNWSINKFRTNSVKSLSPREWQQFYGLLTTDQVSQSSRREDNTSVILSMFHLISLVASCETTFSLAKLIHQAKYYIPGKVVQY